MNKDYISMPNYYFFTMKGDVGMSHYEKERNMKNLKPR